ncbi:hypothetical protein HPB49_019461 [Dermacentor silvarum]|uniref:Uncharacterized protein n=1 Tax=Dermacentor silvarum TaxID=543639 RepID=A0ACB8E2F8_DERSI|nr:hypothetical protein HPB49_019461 [Dermacentor silvarum]
MRTSRRLEMAAQEEGILPLAWCAGALRNDASENAALPDAAAARQFFYLALALVVLLAAAQSGVMGQDEQLLMPWNQYRTSPLLEALRGWIRRPTFTFTRPNFLPALSANAIRLRPGLQQRYSDASMRVTRSGQQWHEAVTHNLNAGAQVLRPMLQRPAIQSMIRPALNLRPVIATGIANLGSLIRRPFLNLEE